MWSPWVLEQPKALPWQRFSQAASTIPPHTQVPQNFDSLFTCTWKSSISETREELGVDSDKDKSHSILQPNTLLSDIASPRLAEQVEMLQDLGEKLLLM